MMIEDRTMAAYLFSVPPFATENVKAKPPAEQKRTYGGSTR